MKGELANWIVVAKAAVYDMKRAEQYLPMMDTRAGAISAVMGVISALEQKRPIPEPIKAMLAVNVYLMMVDVAMNASGEKPSRDAMMATIKAIMQSMSGAQPQQQPPAPQAPAAPQGMLAMGGV